MKPERGQQETTDICDQLAREQASCTVLVRAQPLMPKIKWHLSYSFPENMWENWGHLILYLTILLHLQHYYLCKSGLKQSVL